MSLQDSLIAVLIFCTQAFGEICLLWLNIAGCVYTFFPINRAAAGLMLPYLGWITLATALNYSIWQMNKPAIKEDWCYKKTKKNTALTILQWFLRALWTKDCQKIYVFFKILHSLLCFMNRFLFKSLLQVQSLIPYSLLCFIMSYFLHLAVRNFPGNEADFEKPILELENACKTLVILPRFKEAR